MWEETIPMLFAEYDMGQGFHTLFLPTAQSLWKNLLFFQNL